MSGNLHLHYFGLFYNTPCHDPFAQSSPEIVKLHPHGLIAPFALFVLFMVPLNSCPPGCPI